MTKRIFRSIFIVAISVFLASLTLIMGLLYDYFSKMQQNQLKVQTELAYQGIEHEGIDYFDNLNTDAYRITWIDKDGTIIYDTKSEASYMENHLNREEVQEALNTGYGESSRYSKTLTKRLFYSAKKLPDGTVIRLSGMQYTVLILLFGIAQPIIIVIVIALILSFVLASRLSKKIVRPMNELNLEEPMKNEIYHELQPLLDRIDSQQKQLKLKSAELCRKQEEFNTATRNMSEGIVLLNSKGIILSINLTASRILSISSYCIGKDILMLNNSIQIQELLRKTESGEYAETKMKFGDLEYKIMSNPVVSDEEVTGIALLILDVSEQEKAEQMRREFTANVSHELKTPLQSISGYAELLKNGMVRQEDIPSFSERIYSETHRMITLVDDIINLSHLDEGVDDMERGDVDLYTAAENIMRILQPKAERSEITFILTGNHAVINGIPQLLNAIVFNLCDNALKYNQKNGSVSVEVSNEENAVILSVNDTGIGIPPEHQERIFERFYRVDKSHSKEIGGTGLGLSIVKHAARLHNADIKLQSVVGGGTSITVTFPKNNLLNDNTKTV